jgi:thiol-disulfide isomerase/thioredoxin
MKQLLVILLLATTYAMQAQQKIYETVADPKQGSSKMLVGQLTATNILADNTCTWFEKGMAAYKPDSTIVKPLQALINKYSFIVFIGTWCEDTQQLFPQFYKTIQACKYPEEQLEILGVDRNKQALNIEHLLLRIEKVPTIIISKGPREIGRIIETIDKKNIETQLLYMIQKDIETYKD